MPGYLQDMAQPRPALPISSEPPPGNGSRPLPAVMRRRQCCRRQTAGSHATPAMLQTPSHALPAVMRRRSQIFMFLKFQTFMLCCKLLFLYEKQHFVFVKTHTSTVFQMCFIRKNNASQCRTFKFSICQKMHLLAQNIIVQPFSKLYYCLFNTISKTKQHELENCFFCKNVKNQKTHVFSLYISPLTPDQPPL